MRVVSENTALSLIRRFSTKGRGEKREGTPPPPHHHHTTTTRHAEKGMVWSVRVSKKQTMIKRMVCFLRLAKEREKKGRERVGWLAVCGPLDRACDTTDSQPT